LPTGTVTFVFTDVVGSTALWEEAPEPMRAAMARHDALVEGAVIAAGGTVVRPRGEGDSRFAVFGRTSDALAGAVAVQIALTAEEWATPRPIQVRIAVHTGEAQLRDGDYYGTAVNRCARLRGLAHPGQILVSQAAADLAREALPEGMRLRDVGVHRLKDLTAPEQVHQLDHPDLDGEFPPLTSLDVVANNLPVQLTALVGRERAIGELVVLLDDHRLVTLTGPGGTGKTRLALAAAAEVLHNFPDGVWVAELAPLTEADLVPATIVAAAGVREVAGEAVLDTLAREWARKRVLLVVDNCEHVIDAAAKTIDGLLRATSGLTVVATSQEPLAVGGERVYRVAPLDSPDAVRLFAERARAANAEFVLDPSTTATVEAICARLDGIPLAVELAAARTGSLTPAQIAERLDDRFRLLTGGSRTAPERHRTLAATVEWTHDLLTGPEQILYRRLGVFHGGATLDAIEAICTSEPDDDSGLEPLDAFDLVDLVSGLVDHCLLTLDTRTEPPRYRSLETILHHARTKLEVCTETRPLRDRHLLWLATHAAGGDRAWFGPEAEAWIVRFGAENDNLRAALAWALDGGDAQQGLALASAASNFWLEMARGVEGVKWLTALLEATSDTPSATRAYALAGLAELQTELGHAGEALRLNRAALDVASRSGDPAAEAQANYELAFLELCVSGGRDGLEPLNRAQHLFRGLGHEKRLMSLQVLKGWAYLSRERRDDALACFQEVERWATAHDDTRLPVLAISFDYCLCLLECGHVDEALATSHHAVQVARDSGSLSTLIEMLISEAQVVSRVGDQTIAAGLLRESLALIAPNEQVRVLRKLLGTSAEVVAPTDPTRAAWLAGASARVAETVGMGRAPHEERQLERVLAPVRATLGLEFEPIWQAGAVADLDAVIATALAALDALAPRGETALDR